MNTGLVSVTFRSKSRRQISELAVGAGLQEIEWGGDIHVPHGDISAAADAREICRGSGLIVRSYGSYYKLNSDFTPVVDTASALGADSVRIWAGVSGSRDTDVMTYSALIDTLCQNADEAAARGLSLSFEYHQGTLTDSSSGALRLLSDCGRGNVCLHWQPNQYKDTDYNVSELRRVAQYVDVVHVFAWEGDVRLPLPAHEMAWRRYFDTLRTYGSPRAAYLEFLPAGTYDDLMRDAEELCKIISE